MALNTAALNAAINGLKAAAPYLSLHSATPDAAGSNQVGSRVAASWVATYRVLVGPASGDVALEAGTYDWILRVTDSPEVPVRKVDTVKVVA